MAAMNRLLVLCLLLPAACEQRPVPLPTAATPASADQAALDVLLQRMHQRLDLMHTVARVKWNAQAPILDPAREQALLKVVVERGQAYELDADVTRAFFAAQMDAAKLVQEDDFQRWRAAQQPAFADVPDLSALRQQLDALNGELLALLAQVRPLLNTDEGQKQLVERAMQRFADFTAPVRDAALRPLRR